MNIPKRASLHHAIRASCCAGVSVSWIAATGWDADVAMCSPSTWATPTEEEKNKNRGRTGAMNRSIVNCVPFVCRRRMVMKAKTYYRWNLKCSERDDAYVRVECMRRKIDLYPGIS